MKQMLTIAALLLVTGCSLLVKGPGVDLKAVRITGLDHKGLRMALVLDVRNDNDRELVLTGYRYDLQVGSLPVTRGEVKERTAFPAGSVTDVTVPVTLPYAALAGLLQHQDDAGRVPYRLTASFDVESFFGSVTVPCTKNGTFTIPEQFRKSSILNLLNGLLKK